MNYEKQKKVNARYTRESHIGKAAGRGKASAPGKVQKQLVDESMMEEVNLDFKPRLRQRPVYQAPGNIQMSQLLEKLYF